MLTNENSLKTEVFYPHQKHNMRRLPEFTVKQRREVVVYLYHLKQCRQLKKYGTIQYVSQKMHYVILTLPAKQLDATVASLKKLRFVKYVKTSPQEQITTNFTQAFDEFKDDVRQRLPLAARRKNHRQKAITQVEVISEASSNGFNLTLATLTAQGKAKNLKKPTRRRRGRHKKKLSVQSTAKKHSRRKLRYGQKRKKAKR